MKKALILVLGVFLVAALVGPASAATKFTFNGYYTVRGFWDSNNDLSPKWTGATTRTFAAGNWLQTVGTGTYGATGALPVALAGAQTWSYSMLEDGTVMQLNAGAIGGAGTPTEAHTYNDSYYDHQLWINMNFMPSDRLILSIELNALKEGMWGTNAYNFERAGAQAEPGPEFSRVWMTIKTGIGLFKFGRISAGTSMLQILGHGKSPVDANRHIFGGIAPADSFGWTFLSGPFTLLLHYYKLAEFNGRHSNPVGGTAWPANIYANSPVGPWTTARRYQAEVDYDAYVALPILKFANGAASCLVTYYHNDTGLLGTAATTGYGAVIGAALPAATPAANVRLLHEWAKSLANNRTTFWRVEPSANLRFGPFGLAIGLKWHFGTSEYTQGDKDANTLGMSLLPAASRIELKDQDLKGQGYYLEGSYKYGPGVVGLFYTRISGDGNPNDDTTDGIVTAGGDFKPLYAAFSDYTDYTMQNANNFWMWYAWVDHSLTEDLTLHVAYGYIRRIEKPRLYIGQNGTLQAFRDQALDYGQELDLGIAYKIMDNLTYQAHFGYFWAGDWFKLGSPNLEVGNTYHFDHTLTLNF